MDSCFVACGCNDPEGVTTSDLDRYTDRIENVLSDEKGRKLFRNFMFSSNFKHGRKVLDLWEKIEKLIHYRENADGTASPTFSKDLDKVMVAAERIEVIDYVLLQTFISTVSDNKDRKEINDALHLLKLEATKALASEYDAFRSRYVHYNSRNN
ncbi:hypothetical protein KGM_210807 [Danaus plexippus plexippus]|uniref:RGS domain-containing protein n=1 Tax=Danaus plexippus plexippus TaxID=278856 RepID=A0A212F579_DANPL|nr:hypothetical protein KGM_210807 [Danaus plexippus plexippus]